MAPARACRWGLALGLTLMLSQPLSAQVSLDPRDDLAPIPAGRLQQGDAAGEPDEVVRVVRSRPSA